MEGDHLIKADLAELWYSGTQISDAMAEARLRADDAQDREIKTLIDDAVDKVEAGSRLVNQAGASIQEVVSSVQRVRGIMSEIASASNEQSEGIEQVNQAIGQMDQVTQQNAALVEEAAASAASMREQAASLAEAVDVFKLGGQAVPTLAAPARATAVAARVRLQPEDR